MEKCGIKEERRLVYIFKDWLGVGLLGDVQML
jgi:hypothetical protein